MHAQSYTEILQESYNTSQYLSAVQTQLLLFITHRTHRYDKRKETIPYKHFMKGVFEYETGKVITSRACRCRTSLVKNLRSLQKLNLIKIHKPKGVREAHSYEINIAEIVKRNCKIMSKLKQPKQTKKTGRDSRLQVVGIPDHEAVGIPDNLSRHIEIDKKDKIDMADNSVIRAGSLDDIVEGVKKRSRKKTKETAAKIDTKITAHTLKAKWCSTVIEHYPENVQFSPSVKELGMFKKQNASIKLPVPLSQFMEWSIEHWESLRGSEMSWSDMPRHPDFTFYSRFYTHFAKAFASRRQILGSNERKAARAREGSKHLEAEKQHKREMSRMRSENAQLRQKAHQDAIEKDHLRRVAIDNAKAIPKVKLRPLDELDWGDPIPEDLIQSLDSEE